MIFRSILFPVYAKIHTMKLIFSALLLALLWTTPVFGDDLYVEGIMYEETQPSQSIAVINGNPVIEGGQVGDYKVVKIEKQSVTLSAPSGNTRKVGITKKPSPPEIKESSPVLSADDPTTALKDLPPETLNLLENTVKKAGFDVSDIWTLPQQAVVSASLRNIHTATMMYFVELGEIPTLKKLVKAKYISAEYEDGQKHNYRFSIGEQDGEPTVSAVPMDPKSNGTKFLIDQFGEMKKYK